MITRHLYLTIVLIMVSTFCFASNTECISAYIQDLEQEERVQKDTLAKKSARQERKLIKKQLPKEFPTNYHSEVEAYYQRQSLPKKILRNIINTRNYLSLSSNIAYDAVLIPNITAEFSVHPKVSVALNWMYSWWSFKNFDLFWRTYGGDLACRYWFGKKSEERRLTGHHIGVYAQALTYDLDLGGQAQITDGWNKAVGLEYGHSFIISKNFNIDVFAGVGLLTGKYKDYSNVDGHYVWQVSVNRQIIMPTKFGATLTWILPFKQKSILYEE